jgi:hypothetical protein
VTHGPSRRRRVRIGLAVFAALALLTAVEYAGASIAGQPMLIVAPSAVLKALLITWFFMHIKELVGEDALAEGTTDDGDT